MHLLTFQKWNCGILLKVGYRYLMWIESSYDVAGRTRWIQDVIPSPVQLLQQHRLQPFPFLRSGVECVAKLRALRPKRMGPAQNWERLKIDVCNEPWSIQFVVKARRLLNTWLRTWSGRLYKILYIRGVTAQTGAASLGLVLKLSSDSL